MNEADDAVAVPAQPLHPEADQEERLRRLSRLIRQHFKVENVHIVHIDTDGNWIYLEDGAPAKEIRGGKTLSDLALASPGTLAIADVQSDPRLLNQDISDTPTIMRSYIGRSLETPAGERIGLLCAWGPQPRIFTPDELADFEDVASWVQRELLNIRELTRAANVQKGLLPRASIDLPGYEISGFCRPSQAVGGDFYDWYKSENGAVFTLADVMGKGIGAAIIAATVRAVLRAASRGHRSEEVVQIAAEILVPDLLESGSFVTLIYGRLHIPTNTIQYVDAGHGLTMHITKSGALTRLETTNYPIGLGMHKPWETKTLSMDSGDTLMLLSDGMLAIFNESIEDLLHMVDVARSGESAQKVIESLKHIADNSTAQDDVTALVIRRI